MNWPGHLPPVTQHHRNELPEKRKTELPHFLKIGFGIDASVQTSSSKHVNWMHQLQLASEDAQHTSTSFNTAMENALRTTPFFSNVAFHRASCCAMSMRQSILPLRWIKPPESFVPFNSLLLHIFSQFCLFAVARRLELLFVLVPDKMPNFPHRRR